MSRSARCSQWRWNREAEGLDVVLARLVRDVVEVAVGIRCLVVDGRRQDAVVERQRGRDRLDAAGGAQHVTRHRLTDAARLAATLLAREVYRNAWTGLTEPRVVQGALECREELGWIRPEAVRATDGGGRGRTGRARGC